MKFIYLNKILAPIFFFTMLVSLGSCKKYLDQQPITEVGPEEVFKDVPTTLQAIAGVYNRLAGDNGYGLKLALHYPVDNDIFMGPSGNNDDRRAMAHFSLTSLNAELPAPFNQLFQGIAFANIALDRIPKMEMYNNGSEQQKAQLRRMHGEALTLRAQFYFEALRNWGDLPAHFEPPYVTASQEPFPLRVNTDIIYDRIIEDLATAASLVPWRSEVASIGDPIDERITKGTVKALRARIALFRGGYALRIESQKVERRSDYLKFYQIARDETNDIITSGQHSLYPNYKNLWKDVVAGRAIVDPNGELMFQVTAVGQGSIADSKMGYANGPRVAGRGNSFINPLPHYLYLFDSTDVRREVTIAPYDVAADGITKIAQPSTNWRDGKYRRDWIKNPPVDPNSAVQYFGVKWQLLRYSDVLLMFAEAENEISGPTGAAYNAINMVRRRGFGRPLNTTSSIDIPSGLGKADFFKYVVRERALELGGEGIRKYDLIRWNLLGTGLNEAKDAMVMIARRSGLISYSYMAGPPDYAANAANLPQFMYQRTTAQEDDFRIFINSLYQPSSTTAAPAGQLRVNWAHSSIETTIVTSSTRYAFGYTPNKSELFPIPQPAREANPRLTQNPGY